MLTKLGKEKTLRLNDNFRLKYGTTNAKQFTSLYLQIESWVQPINEDVDFKRSVTYLRKVAYNSVYNNLNRELFASKYIVDLDLRTSGMSADRRSFMCLEVTLFVKRSTTFKSDEITNEVTRLLSTISKDLENNKFSFKPKKK
jgi:hypothetical protein